MQLDPQLTSTVALLSILLVVVSTVTAINITSPKQAIICGETRSDHKLEIEGSLKRERDRQTEIGLVVDVVPLPDSTHS